MRYAIWTIDFNDGAVDSWEESEWDLQDVVHVTHRSRDRVKRIYVEFSGPDNLTDGEVLRVARHIWEEHQEVEDE